MTLNETELYDKLQKHVVPVSQLERHGYPRQDPYNPDLRMVPAVNGVRPAMEYGLLPSYTCRRCKKIYEVDSEGIPLASSGPCISHPGRFWFDSGVERYTCCKKGRGSPACTNARYHVRESEVDFCHNTGFVRTLSKPERDPNHHGIFALDCEMSFTTHGLELTRVTVINYKFEMVYERLVMPANKLLDLNTQYSGIKPSDMDGVTTRLTDVQRDLLELFSSKSLLVGHSLNHDMNALKIFHENFIDTAYLFPHQRGLPYKKALKTLVTEQLGGRIQDSYGHDSKEDASAALRLALLKVTTRGY